MLLKKQFGRSDIGNDNVDILNALDRVLGEDIYCPEDVPGFNRSTMDGYAVKAQDTFGASASLPAILDQVGEVKMGKLTEFCVKRGQTGHIPTGGMLPEGADSVVMVEYTEKMDETTVLVEKPVSPWENVIQKGEDIRQGERLFSKGHVIRSQDVGVLASVGIQTVKVYKKLKVAVISTGNEIADPFKPVPAGKIRDINTFALAASVLKDGMEPVIYGVIEDTFEKLKGTMEEAVRNTDIVLISGGSSVGIMDMTYKVIEAMEDAEIFVHGVAVKPGKPTIIARVGKKAVFGLPGHPVSAFVIYRTIVSRFVRETAGMKSEGITVDALFGENYASAPGRDEFVLIKLEQAENAVIARPIYGKSGMMATMSTADGYVHIPSAKEGLYKDEKVSVQLF